MRLILQNHLLHLVRLVEANVGRVADHKIKYGLLGDGLQHITDRELHPRSQPLGVLAGHVQRLGRKVHGRHLGLRQLDSQADGDGPGAGANVNQPQSFASQRFFLQVGAVRGLRKSLWMKLTGQHQGLLHQVLGLGARNQHGRSDAEVHPPELLMSDDVLQGLARGAAGDERLVLLLLVRRQLALGMRVEMGAVAVRDMKEQHLGAEARGVYVCGLHACRFQPGQPIV